MLHYKTQSGRETSIAMFLYIQSDEFVIYLGM